ncbi:sucrose transport protein SUC1-like [Arachis stenosperma]|uniref:sucrose transport protein SUC1-like n=1 Tax=Arachis stenosperma TaxID=217475 RepID=UPI0025ABBD85|nr:sucrose transport protein SUC1-like [Arachis stenosperma]
MRGKRKLIDGQRLNASRNISGHEGAEETDVTADGGCGIQLGSLVRVLLYGARCLILTWVVTGLMSLAVEPIGRVIGGTKNLWAAKNFILVGGLALTLYINKLATDERLERNDLTFTLEPSNGIRAWVLHFFGDLGIPLGITLSVAPALTSIYSNESGAEKGLPLNLTIGVSNIIVATLNLPWNNVFGGENLSIFEILSQNLPGSRELLHGGPTSDIRANSAPISSIRADGDLTSGIRDDG